MSGTVSAPTCRQSMQNAMHSPKHGLAGLASLLMCSSSRDPAWAVMQSLPVPKTHPFRMYAPELCHVMRFSRASWHDVLIQASSGMPQFASRSILACSLQVKIKDEDRITRPKIVKMSSQASSSQLYMDSHSWRNSCLSALLCPWAALARVQKTARRRNEGKSTVAGQSSFMISSSQSKVSHSRTVMRRS